MKIYRFLIFTILTLSICIIPYKANAKYYDMDSVHYAMDSYNYDHGYSSYNPYNSGGDFFDALFENHFWLGLIITQILCAICFFICSKSDYVFLGIIFLIPLLPIIGLILVIDKIHENWNTIGPIVKHIFVYMCVPIYLLCTFIFKMLSKFKKCKAEKVVSKEDDTIIVKKYRSVD